MLNDPFDIGDSDSEGTIFRDVIMLALAGFMVIVILLLPHINPEAKKASEDQQTPGNMSVIATWPPELNTDVDLWVQGPTGIPVGYSNKGNELFNLVRDDLGTEGDSSGLNFENIYSRGLPPGEYIVNLHLYRNLANVYPVTVHVAIGTKTAPTVGFRYILKRTVQLTELGQEITVVRFKIDKDGNLIGTSVHDVFRKLRMRPGNPS